MSNYAVRLTYSYATLQSFFVKLKEYNICSRFAVYEHPMDAKVSRTHCHALLMDVTCSTDTLKNKISECLKFRPNGNSEWTFKTKYKPYKATTTVTVDDKYMIYMSKGKFEPCITEGYTNDQINEFKKSWVPMGPNAEIKLVDGKLIVNDSERKSLTKRELLQLMVAKFNDKIIQEQSPDARSRKIFKMIRNVLVAQGEPVGENKIMDYYDSVVMHGDASSFIDNCMNRLNKRYR